MNLFGEKIIKTRIINYKLGKEYYLCVQKASKCDYPEKPCKECEIYIKEIKELVE